MGSSMVCGEILPKCFDNEYHFASGQQVRLEAVEYLKCHLKALDAWLEVQQEIRDFLRLQGVAKSQIEKEVKKAKRFLEPWLP